MNLGIWERVDNEVAAVLALRPNEYDQATLDNLRELVDLLKTTGRPAPVVGAGYGATLVLTWTSADASNLEVEIFEDRYETYWFFDSSTTIRHHAHLPGEALSAAFVNELPKPGSPAALEP